MPLTCLFNSGNFCTYILKVCSSRATLSISITHGLEQLPCRKHSQEMEMTRPRADVKEPLLLILSLPGKGSTRADGKEPEQTYGFVALFLKVGAKKPNHENKKRIAEEPNLNPPQCPMC